MKLNKTNKTFLYFGFALLALVGLVLVYPKEENTVNSSVAVSESSQAYDLSSLAARVGFSDNVFVAKVQKIEAIYMQKNTDGTSDGKSPATIYRLNILENIKGNLSTSKPVLLYKDGGVLPDGTTVIQENDLLPDVGSYYIFTASIEGGAPAGITTAVPEGTLNSSGENSTVLLDKDEVKALKSSKIKDFENAFKNQRQFNTSRFPIKGSEVYTS